MKRTALRATKRTTKKKRRKRKRRLRRATKKMKRTPTLLKVSRNHKLTPYLCSLGIKTEWIYPYLQNMLFEFLLKQIEDINYEVIKFNFWNIDAEVNNNWDDSEESDEDDDANDAAK